MTIVSPLFAKELEPRSSKPDLITPPETDRIAEAAEKCEAGTHVINIQGDEPLLEPELVDTLARELRNNCDLPMITAGSSLDNPELIADPNIVKTGHRSTQKRALLFTFSHSLSPK